MKTVEGNLIAKALNGEFDVIVHGCNCFNKMMKGIALEMDRIFGCNSFPLEAPEYRGDINKLGQIDFKRFNINDLNGTIVDSESAFTSRLFVVNAYTQYFYGPKLKPFDQYAFRIICKKLNHQFKGLHIGLPMIGAGLGGGDWDIIQHIIDTELTECEVTIVKFK